MCAGMCTRWGLTSILLADHDVRSEPVELRAIRQPVKAGSARGAAAWVWRRQYPVRPATLRREDEDESFEHVCLGGLRHVMKSVKALCRYVNSVNTQCTNFVKTGT